MGLSDLEAPYRQWRIFLRDAAGCSTSENYEICFEVQIDLKVEAIINEVRGAKP